jgi:cytoskeletal protein RodZ
MPGTDRIEQELREQYPWPSAAATERARAAVTRAATERPRQPGRRRFIALALAAAAVGAGSVAAWQAFQGNAPNRPRIPRARNAAPTYSTIATPPDCPARTGSGAYDTTLSPASGPPGSTVTASGSLPVIAQDGADVGQTSNEVDVYWNLDFDNWWSALGASPSTSVAGSPVKFLGEQDVAKLCTYQVQVEIPPVAPGAYPIEVLYQGPDQGGPSVASFAPVNFQVVGG